MKKSTSWGEVANWYESNLKKEGSYQAEVILPNLSRLLALKKSDTLLDLACGEGFFAREFAKTGAKIIGADISPELIQKAKVAERLPAGRQGPILYKVAPAAKLAFAKDKEFTTVVCVLALQNMEDIKAVFTEVRRVLAPKGRLVMVLNHPTFRVLKRSSWGFDEAAQVQYRRIDGYLSAAKIMVDMHPGKEKSAQTVSYHRSLQDFTKALAASGFAITRLEEWTSHKVSGKGPRQKAEDTARKEIPLFMAIEAEAKE